MRQWSIGFAFATIVSTTTATATEGLIPNTALEDTLSWINLSGSLRGGYWSGSRNLDDRHDLAVGSVWLKAAPQLGDFGNIVFDGRHGNHAFPGSGQPERVREFYLESSYGNVDLRVGRQLLIWGRADRLNPTDNITPRDFTLLVPEDTDQRFGTFMVKGAYHLDSLSFTAIWSPEFEPNVVPIAATPGIRLSEEVETHRRSWAVRLEQSGAAIDWSLSYLDGFNLNVDIGIAAIEPSGLVLSLRHLPTRVVGADLATTVGRYGLRAEAAYTRTEDTSGVDPFVMNSLFYLVAGGDRTFFEYLNVNLQAFVRHVSDFKNANEITDPLVRMVAVQEAIITNQLDRNTYGLAARISNKWFYTTLDAELVAVYSWPRHDYVVRPKLSYAFTDRWIGTLGADVFRGDPQSFYGRLRSNSLVFGEIRFTF
ncbi:MAG TPA: hypothetical protein VGA00_13075 [Acidiferrobacterales bacterium]|jgi:hypothetical protein